MGAHGMGAGRREATVTAAGQQGPEGSPGTSLCPLPPSGVSPAPSSSCPQPAHPQHGGGPLAESECSRVAQAPRQPWADRRAGHLPSSVRTCPLSLERSLSLFLILAAAWSLEFDLRESSTSEQQAVPGRGHKVPQRWLHGTGAQGCPLSQLFLPPPTTNSPQDRWALHPEEGKTPPTWGHWPGGGTWCWQQALQQWPWGEGSALGEALSHPAGRVHSAAWVQPGPPVWVLLSHQVQGHGPSLSLRLLILSGGPIPAHPTGVSRAPREITPAKLST